MCGADRGAHKVIHSHVFIGEDLESPGSASSSPDERCKCGLRREEHDKVVSTSFHAFVPAEPEAPSAFVPWEETKATAAQEAAIQEPEAPEPESGCAHCGGPHDWNDCSAYAEAVRTDAPRRPPYAVAYTLADGEQYEVALPGDATVRAQEGALVITHASAVQALIQIRPMEGA